MDSKLRPSVQAEIDKMASRMPPSSKLTTEQKVADPKTTVDIKVSEVKAIGDQKITEQQQIIDKAKSNSDRLEATKLMSPGKYGIRLPWIGDTIRFNLKPTDSVSISWSEHNDAFEAVYYKTQARWLHQEDPSKQSEVTLWIAREFVDEEYQDIWEKEQISRWAKGPVSNGQVNGSFKSNTFAEVKIGVDSGLVYGQSGDLTRRFLVYHPRNRMPSQGRFQEGALNRVLKSVGDYVPGFADVQLNPEMWKGLGNLLQTTFGHALKPFTEAMDAEAVVVDLIQLWKAKEENDEKADSLSKVLEASAKSGNGDPIVPVVGGTLKMSIQGAGGPKTDPGVIVLGGNLAHAQKITTSNGVPTNEGKK